MNASNGCFPEQGGEEEDTSEECLRNKAPRAPRCWAAASALRLGAGQGWGGVGWDDDTASRIQGQTPTLVLSQILTLFLKIYISFVWHFAFK